MATFTSKKKGSPKRWKGQVWFQGRMAAVKWFGSGRQDEKAAIAPGAKLGGAGKITVVGESDTMVVEE